MRTRYGHLKLRKMKCFFFSDGKMTENTFSSGISVNGSSVFQSYY